MRDQTVFDDSQSKILEASKDRIERPVLVQLDGADFKNRYRIDKREVVIGRDVGCDIALSDSKSSRRHVKLVYHNFDQPTSIPKISLQDLKSTNGTFVNGVRVGGVDLQERDKILVGSTLFGFFLRDEQALQADETLIRLASRDALTALFNRGIFNVEMKKEFERARRYDRPLSLLMFDIDHFKKFNDSYGHQMGDTVLKELGNVIAMNGRHNDVAARYGGEEFALILPETPLEKALVYAERLRTVIMNHSFASEATRLGVTVSMGLAGQEPWMEGPADLIDAADRALYQAKGEGRNRVCITRPTPERLRKAG